MKLWKIKKCIRIIQKNDKSWSNLLCLDVHQIVGAAEFAAVTTPDLRVLSLTLTAWWAPSLLVITTTTLGIMAY